MITTLHCLTSRSPHFPVLLFAYADPGSGALLAQLLVASFVGFLFQIRKITSWFKDRRKDKRQR